MAQEPRAVKAFNDEVERTRKTNGQSDWDGAYMKGALARKQDQNANSMRRKADKVESGYEKKKRNSGRKGGRG
jgi:hypothetical protein